MKNFASSLLDMLNMKGVFITAGVTAGARHCHGGMGQVICDRGSDFALHLKSNQIKLNCAAQGLRLAGKTVDVT